MPKLNSQERVRALEERLGTTFSRPELALTALTHSSYANEHPEERLKDNERLEFLGDAVVDLAVSQRLYERFPDAPEGQMSRMHAYLVDTVGLARVARGLKLGELLLLGRGEERSGGRDRNSVLADALEAILAALYLDSGLEAVQSVVDRHFAEVLDEVSRTFGRDFKTRLQQLVQERLKLPPVYQVVSESGPDHRKIFEVEVCIGSEVFGRGTGSSKREAEQAAARHTLELIEQGRELKGMPSEQAPPPSAGPKEDTPV